MPSLQCHASSSNIAGDICGDVETEETPRIFVRGVPDFRVGC
jgi:hypothetical protein